jgi:hypothetical protein
VTANQPSGNQGYWRSRSGIALCVFIAIAALLLFFEHRAHALQWLPFVVLLACPLMHLFMHHGHGGHSHGARRNSGNGS